MKKISNLIDLRGGRLKSSLASLSSEIRLEEDVKPYAAMPSPPAWPLLGHMPLLAKKKNQERLDQMFHKLRLQLGDIYRLSVPGQGDMVVIFRPEDVRAMYASDGRIPYQVDKPARLTIRVLWFLFLIVRRVPRPSESGCKKCNGLKKYLLGHLFS